MRRIRAVPLDSRRLCRSSRSATRREGSRERARGLDGETLGSPRELSAAPGPIRTMEGCVSGTPTPRTALENDRGTLRRSTFGSESPLAKPDGIFETETATPRLRVDRVLNSCGPHKCVSVNHPSVRVRPFFQKPTEHRAVLRGVCVSRFLLLACFYLFLLCFFLCFFFVSLFSGRSASFSRERLSRVSRFFS